MPHTQIFRQAPAAGITLSQETIADLKAYNGNWNTAAGAAALADVKDDFQDVSIDQEQADALFNVSADQKENAIPYTGIGNVPNGFHMIK
jgi:hypothetical protein